MQINKISELSKTKNAFLGNTQGFKTYKDNLQNFFFVDITALETLKKYSKEDEIDDEVIEKNKNFDLVFAQNKLHKNLQSAKDDSFMAASFKNYYSEIFNIFFTSDYAHAAGTLFCNPNDDKINYFGYFNDKDSGLQILKTLREIHACEEEELKKANTPRKIYVAISASNCLALSKLKHPQSTPEELKHLNEIYEFRQMILDFRYPNMKVSLDELDNITKKYNDSSIRRVKENVNTYCIHNSDIHTH